MENFSVGMNVKRKFFPILTGVITELKDNNMAIIQIYDREQNVREILIELDYWEIIV